MNDNIRLYRTDLEKAAFNKENRIVLNDGADKASVLTTVLMTHAKKYVYMYSNSLNKDVTEDANFIEAFTKILKDENIEVKILLNEQTNNENIQILLDNYNGTLNNECKIVKNKQSIENIFRNKKIHFSVYDDVAYRLEHDIERYKADANFNNPEFSLGLKELFLYLFNN